MDRRHFLTVVFSGFGLARFASTSIQEASTGEDWRNALLSGASPETFSWELGLLGPEGQEIEADWYSRIAVKLEFKVTPGEIKGRLPSSRWECGKAPKVHACFTCAGAWEVSGVCLFANGQRVSTHQLRPSLGVHSGDEINVRWDDAD